MNKFISKLKYILIPVIVGGIVGFIISNFIDYDNLNKPFYPLLKLLFLLYGLFYIF